MYSLYSIFYFSFFPTLKKYLKFGLYGFATITLLLYGLAFLNPDNIFKIKRDFNYKEIRSGYKFVWQQDKR
jgi:hypothetical protein